MSAHDKSKLSMNDHSHEKIVEKHHASTATTQINTRQRIQMSLFKCTSEQEKKSEAF